MGEIFTGKFVPGLGVVNAGKMNQRSHAAEACRRGRNRLLARLFRGYIETEGQTVAHIDQRRWNLANISGGNRHAIRQQIVRAGVSDPVCRACHNDRRLRHFTPPLRHFSLY